jgi:hypothetical protein
MRAALIEHQGDVAEAVVRIAKVPSLRYAREPLRNTTADAPKDDPLEEWLRFAVRVRRLGVAAREVLDPWLDKELAERSRQWQEGRGNGRGAVRLLATMHAGGMRRQAKALIPLVKQWLTDVASSADEYDLLDDLRHISDDVFQPDEWDHVVRGFEMLAGEVLTWGPDTEAELDRLEEVAAALGVRLDEDELEHARIPLRQPEPDDDYAPDEHRAVLSPDLFDPDADIAALFDRLNDADDAA